MLKTVHFTQVLVALLRWCKGNYTHAYSLFCSCVRLSLMSVEELDSAVKSLRRRPFLKYSNLSKMLTDVTTGLKKARGMTFEMRLKYSKHRHRHSVEKVSAFCCGLR